MTDLRFTSFRDVKLRAAKESDREWLYQLFIASHDDLSIAVAAWDEQQKDVFLQIQFQAQQNHYRGIYPESRCDVILMHDEVIGQILVANIGDELRLVDVSLLPEFRNRGIGSALLRDLLEEAAGENKRVTLHVLQGNPAVCLYQRLGFSHVGEQGIYRRMEWVPACGTSTRNKAQLPTSVS